MNQPSNWNSICRKAAEDIVRVLSWFGSFQDNRIPKMWSTVLRSCGPQTNSDDCGVFVAAYAASVVLQTPVPTCVDDFRAIMARWVLFLHQEEGPQLDKFVRDTVLAGWCHVSHKCHWAFCFNVAHLEQVSKTVNDDPSVCKNRSWANDGGCNALHSLHPHDHCLLVNPHGSRIR